MTSPHPIRIVVSDDLHRSRLTVFFRLLLAFPHFFWVGIWSTGVAFVVLVNWFAILFKGRSPASLHDFLVRYIRYVTHVEAYLSLAANPYPGFTGDPGRYPVDVEIDPPELQNRWKVGFRIFLAVPAILIATSLGGGGSSGNRWSFSSGVVPTVAFFAWFACVARGRLTQGFRDLTVYGLGYGAQMLGYALLVTDRYPDSSPARAPIGEPPPLPVRLAVSDDGRRSRLTVFFRVLLALPHVVWLLLWAIVAYLAAIASWFVTLARGTPPEPLHRFLAAFVRYQTHVLGFLLLTANPFPGFTGTPGRYPLDLEVTGVERQNRWVTGFRGVLAIPAVVLASAFGGTAYTAAFLGWFASLVTGRMPSGLRDVSACYLRYNAHVTAYALLLSDRYPYSGPVLGASAATADGVAGTTRWGGSASDA